MKVLLTVKLLRKESSKYKIYNFSVKKQAKCLKIIN
jgi:hypothetical protein